MLLIKTRLEIFNEMLLPPEHVGNLLFHERPACNKENTNKSTHFTRLLSIVLVKLVYAYYAPSTALNFWK